MATQQTQTIIQRRVEGSAPKWRHGAIAYPGRNPRVRKYRNLEGGAVQIQTLLVATYSAEAVYSFNVALPTGEIATVSYTESGDTNVNGVAAKLAAKINARGDLRSFGKATVNTATVTFTGNEPGVSATITTSDAKLTPTETQAAAPYALVPFGRVILRDGSQDGELKGKLAAPLSTARSLTVTHGGSSGPSQIKLLVDGAEILGEGTSAANLKTSLDGLLPATGFTVTVNSNDVVIAATVAGEQFELLEITGALTLKTNVQGDDLNRAIAGLSVYHDLSADGVGTYGGYPIDVLEEDEIALEIPGVSSSSKLYVGTSGADKGKVFAARAAGRVYISRLRVDEVNGSFAVVNLAP